MTNEIIQPQAMQAAESTKEEEHLAKYLNTKIDSSAVHIPNPAIEDKTTNKEKEDFEIESTEDELKETEIITIEIEKEFVINTGNYSSIKQRYGIKREGRTKNITSFLQQTDDIISKKVNEQFNKIKASL